MCVLISPGMMIRPLRSIVSSPGCWLNRVLDCPTAAILELWTRIAPSSIMSREELTVMMVAWRYNMVLLFLFFYKVKKCNDV